MEDAWWDSHRTSAPFLISILTSASSFASVFSWFVALCHLPFAHFFNLAHIRCPLSGKKGVISSERFHMRICGALQTFKDKSVMWIGCCKRSYGGLLCADVSLAPLTRWCRSSQSWRRRRCQTWSISCNKSLFLLFLFPWLILHKLSTEAVAIH